MKKCVERCTCCASSHGLELYRRICGIINGIRYVSYIATVPAFLYLYPASSSILLTFIIPLSLVLRREIACSNTSGE